MNVEDHILLETGKIELLQQGCQLLEQGNDGQEKDGPDEKRDLPFEQSLVYEMAHDKRLGEIEQSGNGDEERAEQTLSPVSLYERVKVI